MWIDYEDYGPENLKEGDQLRVIRLPVLYRPDPPAEKETVKTVTGVKRGRQTLVHLKGHTSRVGGVTIPRYFRAGGSQLYADPPRPLRYQVLEVLPSIIVEG